MKEKVKSIVIVVLVLAIAIGGYSYWSYQKNVNKVLNYSIYSSLNVTQQELLDIRVELKEYDNKQMSVEEFKNVLSKSRDYFFYGDYTKKFDYLGERFAYSDYAQLNFYMLSLSWAEMSTEDVEYHKDNLMKIIKLWAPLTLKSKDNYLEPTPQLKKVLEETTILSNKGLQRTQKKQ